MVKSSPCPLGQHRWLRRAASALRAGGQQIDSSRWASCTAAMSSGRVMAVGAGTCGQRPSSHSPISRLAAPVRLLQRPVSGTARRGLPPAGDEPAPSVAVQPSDAPKAGPWGRASADQKIQVDIKGLFKHLCAHHNESLSRCSGWSACRCASSAPLLLAARSGIRN